MDAHLMHFTYSHNNVITLWLLHSSMFCQSCVAGASFQRKLQIIPNLGRQTSNTTVMQTRQPQHVNCTLVGIALSDPWG